MEELKGDLLPALADGGCTLASSGDIDFSAGAAGGYSQTVAGVANQSFDLRWNVTTANGLRKIVRCGPSHQRNQADADECTKARQHS